MSRGAAENTTGQHPANPYASFVVRASAGTGKTYQLSQRYIRLVAAGANPAEILAVTFTRKAAAEMKDRIFEDAVTLLASPEASAALDAEMAGLYKIAIARHTDLRPPIPAAKAAETILNHSQSLKIQTTDSLFQELVQRFPIEAGEEIPIPFRIADTSEREQIVEESFIKLFELAEAGDAELASLLRQYLTSEEGGTAVLRQSLEYLNTQRLYLWELKQKHNKTWRDFLLAPHPECAGMEPEDVASSLADQVENLAGRATQKAASALLEAARTLRQDPDPACLRGPLFKKNNGWDIKVALESKLQPDEVALIEAMVYDLQCSRVNRTASLIYALYDRFEKESAAEKIRQGLVDFDDLSQGAYRLMHDPDCAGARFHLFLRTTHLLVDEFQDTSHIQWDIFEAIAVELLSGENLATEKRLVPTVFLVGDAKQSIYGFRQGDYRLLGHVSTLLGEQFEVETLQLDKSWRASQFLLDHVNTLFESGEVTGMLPDYSTHSTAELDGKPVVPAYGSFTALAPLVKEKGEKKEELRLRQAEQIAALINHWKRTNVAVFDREMGCHRPLRNADIGILYRAATQGNQLENALVASGIPCIREEKKGYYDRREVEDILQLLYYMAQPEDEVALATLLRSPMLAVPDADLMTLLKARADSPGKSLFRVLKARLPETAGVLEKVNEKRGIWSIDRLLLRFLESTHAFARYRLAFGEEAGRLAQANLLQLLEILGTATPKSSGSILEYIERLKTFRGVDETGNAQFASDSVTLMTMHKAKGLEFPVVLVVGGEQPLHQSNRSGDTGFRKYMMQDKPFVYLGRKKADRPPKIEELERFAHLEEDEQRRESVRLLYVAVTRAKEHFVVTSVGEEGAESFYTFLTKTVFREVGQHSDEVAPGVLGTQRANFAVASEEMAQQDRDKPEIALPDVEPGPGGKGITMRRPSETWLDEEDVSSENTEQARLLTSRLAAVIPEHERARLLGKIIHHHLAALARGENARPTAFVRRERAESMVVFSDEEISELLRDALAHAERAWACQKLQDLVAHADRCEAEFRILHLHGSELVNGIVDLLIDDGKTLWIIDYKSAKLEGRSPSEQVSVGKYDVQLQHYANAVAALHPGRPCRMAVVFTETGQFLEVQ